MQQKRHNVASLLAKARVCWLAKLLVIAARHHAHSVFSAIMNLFLMMTAKWQETTRLKWCGEFKPPCEWTEHETERACDLGNSWRSWTVTNSPTNEKQHSEVGGGGVSLRVQRSPAQLRDPPTPRMSVGSWAGAEMGRRGGGVLSRLLLTCKCLYGYH